VDVHDVGDGDGAGDETVGWGEGDAEGLVPACAGASEAISSPTRASGTAVNIAIRISFPISFLDMCESPSTVGVDMLLQGPCVGVHPSTTSYDIPPFRSSIEQ
jgi:hypothetical protein